MLAHFLWVGLGVFVTLLWQFIFDRGHAVFGVKSRGVQDILVDVIKEYTGLRPLHMIHSGPTYQQVLSGGTVIAYFEDSPDIAGLPRNARSCVVWGKKRRRKAAEQLMMRLKYYGCEATIHEPLKQFPSGTFLMVKSDAFIDCAFAFRPHWIKMAFLESRAKKN